MYCQSVSVCVFARVNSLAKCPTLRIRNVPGSCLYVFKPKLLTERQQEQTILLCHKRALETNTHTHSPSTNTSTRTLTHSHTLIQIQNGSQRQFHESFNRVARGGKLKRNERQPGRIDGCWMFGCFSVCRCRMPHDYVYEMALCVWECVRVWVLLDIHAVKVRTKT